MEQLAEAAGVGDTPRDLEFWSDTAYERARHTLRGEHDAARRLDTLARAAFAAGERFPWIRGTREGDAYPSEGVLVQDGVIGQFRVSPQGGLHVAWANVPVNGELQNLAQSVGADSGGLLTRLSEDGGITEATGEARAWLERQAKALRPLVTPRATAHAAVRDAEARHRMVLEQAEAVLKEAERI